MNFHPIATAVLENMTEAVYVRDLDMKILYINPASERLTGWSLSEACRKKCWEVFGDENRTCRDVCPVEKVIAENTAREHHEGELKTRDGNVRKMRVSISPMQDGGRVTGAVVVMDDITDFREIEETHLKTVIALEKEVARRKLTEERLSKAQEIAHVGNWDWHIAINELWWSDEIYRMFGIEPRVFGATYEAFLETVHRDDREFVMRSVDAALNGNELYGIDHRIVLPDGSEKMVHEQAEVTFDETGHPVRMIGTVQDITERKRRETEYLRLKERMELILASAGEGIYGVDLDGRTVFVNPASASMFGCEQNDMLGRIAHDLFHHTKADGTVHPREECPIYLTSRDGQTRDIEDDVFWRKDGTPFPVKFIATPMGDDHTIIGAVVVFQDITERKVAEAELLEKSAELERSNREYHEFARVISHDLQEPLRTVSGFVKLLEQQYKGRLDESADEFIHFAVDGAERMSAMIRDLLEYSRVQTKAKESEQVLLRETMDAALANLKVSIEEAHANVTVPDDLPTVMGDGSQLTRLFQNLIGNAIKYRDPARAPEVHVEVRQQDGEWLFSVRDNGIGIEAKNHDRIFGVFQRLHGREEYDGTGIVLLSHETPHFE